MKVWIFEPNVQIKFDSIQKGGIYKHIRLLFKHFFKFVGDTCQGGHMFIPKGQARTFQICSFFGAKHINFLQFSIKGLPDQNVEKVKSNKCYKVSFLEKSNLQKIWVANHVAKSFFGALECILCLTIDMLINGEIQRH